MKVEKYNHEDKKKKHIENRKEQEAKIGPGTYINPKTHSEFRLEPKPESLQFFGTTEERFRHFPVNLAASTGAITAAAAAVALNSSGNNL